MESKTTMSKDKDLKVERTHVSACWPFAGQEATWTVTTREGRTGSVVVQASNNSQEERDLVGRRVADGDVHWEEEEEEEET